MRKHSSLRPASLRKTPTDVLRFGFVALALLVTSQLVTNQEANAQLSYQHGQNVSPAFEGWEENDDGSFNLVFGYMNRNWQEDLDVPVGPDNNIFYRASSIKTYISGYNTCWIPITHTCDIGKEFGRDLRHPYCLDLILVKCPSLDVGIFKFERIALERRYLRVISKIIWIRIIK